MISKTTFTYTVLHRTDTPPSDVYVALGEAMDGHMVGAQMASETEPVAREDVRTELLAVGNDGGFFDFDFDEEGAE